MNLDRLISLSPWKLFPFILFFVAAAYSNSLYSPLVLDDLHSFVEEPRTYQKDISLDALRQIADTKFGKARLIPLITFAIDHKLAGNSVVQFHLTNIIIHLLATIALFLFLQSIFHTPAGKTSLQGLSASHLSLFAAALWALNPVQTNAVTYIVQRMTSLAALFYMLALTCYVHARLSSRQGRRILFYMLFSAASFAALLSKENCSTLPLAILLMELLLLAPESSAQLLGKIKWYHWVGLLLLTIILLPLAERPWHGLIQGYHTRHFTLTERLLTEPRIVVHYLSLLLLPLPSRMNLDYDFNLSSSLISPPTTILSLLFIFFLLAAAFHWRRRYPLISFGIFWFFLQLIVESTVISLELAFEHRLYLPSAGFYIAGIGTVCATAKYWRNKCSTPVFNQAFFLLMVILIATSSIFTTLRNNDWRDGLSIYSDCVKKSPDKARPYDNLGLVLGRAGRNEEAIPVLDKAIALGRPFYEDYVNATNNIMICLIKLERYDEAITRGEKCLREINARETNMVGFPRLMRSLGSCYYETGEYNFAFEAYMSGLRLEDHAINYFLVSELEHLLHTAYEQDKYREELGLVNEKCPGKNVVLLRMAELMLAIRDYDKAIQYIKKMQTAEPGNLAAEDLLRQYDNEIANNQQQAEKLDIHNHLPYKTNALYRFYLNAFQMIMENYSPLAGQAGWLLSKAALLEPADPFVSIYYGEWFLKQGKPEAAMAELDKTLQRYPDFIPGLDLAGSILLHTNKVDKAIEYYSHILDLYPGHSRWQYYQNEITKNEVHLLKRNRAASEAKAADVSLAPKGIPAARNIR